MVGQTGSADRDGRAPPAVWGGVAAGTSRRLRLALAAAVAVPALLFAGAAAFDRARLLHEAEADARRAATASREHALKAVETHELLVRQLDLKPTG